MGTPLTCCEATQLLETLKQFHAAIERAKGRQFTPQWCVSACERRIADNEAETINELAAVYNKLRGLVLQVVHAALAHDAHQRHGSVEVEVDPPRTTRPAREVGLIA
jgi:hypothetical protein